MGMGVTLPPWGPPKPLTCLAGAKAPDQRGKDCGLGEHCPYFLHWDPLLRWGCVWSSELLTRWRGGEGEYPNPRGPGTRGGELRAGSTCCSDNPRASPAQQSGPEC